MQKLLLAGFILVNLILLPGVFAQQGGVLRSAFTSDVVDREPVDDLDTVFTDVNKIYFFTELKDLAGQKVSHRWIFGDQVLAEVAFNVQGERWRVHSSKTLSGDWLGEWRVEVADSQNNVLHEDSFVYVSKAGAMTKGEEAPQSSAAEKSAVQTSPEIKRAIFTTSIVDREPENEIDSLSTDVTSVYFFTEVVGMQNKSIKHRWIYNGEVKAEISFEIKADRWRVYSSKTLLAEWTGTWTVEVVDVDSNVLAEKNFVYVAQ